MALLGLVNSYAQVAVCNAYADMSRWTGNSVFNGGNLSVTGNTDGQRMFLPVGTLSNTWQAQVGFTPTNRSTAGPCLTLLAVTAGTKDWNYDGPYSSTNTTFSNQDGIAILWNSDYDNNSSYLSICIKDGATRTVQNVALGLITNNVNYNVRLDRLTATTGRLTVTTGGTNIAGSPFAINNIPSTVVGLNTIQQGTTLGASPDRNCTATVSALSIINELTAPNSNAPITICAGNTVTLGQFAAVTNPSYNWSLANSTNPITYTTVSTSQNYVTPKLYASTKYYASYTVCGIKSPLSEVVVTVNPTPIVASIITTETVFCSGKISLLTCATPNGVWSSSNTAIATVSSNGFVTGVTAGTVDILYTVSNSSNCKVTSKLSIVVGGKVQPFSIVGTTPNCPGSNSTYTVNPIVANARYYWVLDNGVSMYHYDGVSTKVNVSFPDAPGANYTLKAVAINACGSTAEVSLPIAIKSDVPNKPKMLCSDIQNCTTLNLQTPPNSGVTVTWNNGGTIVSGVNSVTRAKDKQVYVTFSKNGCNYSDSYFAGYCVAGTPTLRTGNERVENELTTIYPNPNDGNFTFETSGVAGNAYVLNSMGEIVSEITLENNKTFYQMNLSNLLKGTYILKIVDGVSFKNSVFIVQ